MNDEDKRYLKWCFQANNDNVKCKDKKKVYYIGEKESEEE